MQSKNARASHKGSGDMVNSFIIIMAILVVMLVAVATFVGSVAKRERIIFDEVELMRAKNTFYLVNRSVGMTWFISTVQTVFRAENGMGEPYWYITNPQQRKNIRLPEASKCNIGNPRICLPRNNDVADFLKNEMQDYLNIKGSDRQAEQRDQELDLNDVMVNIENIDINSQYNFWPSYDRITSLVTQEIKSIFGASKTQSTTESNNAIFTLFRKIVAGGWLVVDVASQFNSEVNTGIDYPASPGDTNMNYAHTRYIAEKQVRLFSKTNEVTSWLTADIISGFVLNAMNVKVSTTETGILAPRTGIVLSYDVKGTFSERVLSATPLGTGVTSSGTTGIPAPYNTIFARASGSEGTPAALIAAIFKCGEHAGNSCPTASCRTDNPQEEFSRPWPDSNGPWASSPAGAQGPFQFMPSTWAIYSRDCNNDGVGDVQNLEDSACGASAYLRACATSIHDPLRPTEWNQAWCYNHDSTYADKVYNCFVYLESQITGMSCPMADPVITCGSLGSGHPSCEHCGRGYGTPLPSWCSQFPRTVTGIDVTGPGGFDTYSVQLPRINGQSVTWRFVSIEGGASGLGFGKTFSATLGPDTYSIYLTHLKNEGGFSSGREGTTAQSGTIAGSLFPNVDGAGRGHVHIQVMKNGAAINNPEIELSLCSSGSSPPPISLPPQTSYTGYYYHDEPNNRFIRRPFTLSVRVKDYLSVLDCSNRRNVNSQFNWLTEKDMACSGNELYACQETAYLSTTREIPGMEAGNKKTGTEELGTSPNILQCVTDCDETDKSLCLPIFCKEHVDGINPRQDLKQCCDKWDWGSSPTPVWRGKTLNDDGTTNVDNTCNSMTYCFGDAYTDKDRKEICDYRNVCPGVPTKDDAKDNGCSFYCAPEHTKWDCSQNSEVTCADGQSGRTSDPRSDAALAQAYEYRKCAVLCGADVVCDGKDPATCGDTRYYCNGAYPDVEQCKKVDCGISGYVPNSYRCSSLGSGGTKQQEYRVKGCADPRSGCYDDQEWRNVESCGSDEWTSEYRCNGGRERKVIRKGCSQSRGVSCYSYDEWVSSSCPSGQVCSGSGDCSAPTTTTTTIPSSGCTKNEDCGYGDFCSGCSCPTGQYCAGFCQATYYHCCVAGACTGNFCGGGSDCSCSNCQVSSTTTSSTTTTTEEPPPCDPDTDPDC